MVDKQDKKRHNDIWDLLYEYADIRDELKDTLLSFQELHAEIEYAMEDITDELESLQEHLAKCSERLVRFRKPRHSQCEVSKEQSGLPFMD